MGRGIRSRDDYRVVLLIGARLIRRLHDPGAAKHFSAATAAQLQMSRLFAEQLADGDATDLRAVVEQSTGHRRSGKCVSMHLGRNQGYWSWQSQPGS